MTAIVDMSGRILAAQIDAERANDANGDMPSAELVQLPGQRTVEMDVPDEIRDLSGPELSRFFYHVEIVWPATVNVPRIEIVGEAHDSSET
ncbi:hypothetical protein [Pseudonocardia hierapolitana]|uniref:hypothetical protein n=1 Tax=Pseudonocardia hierapolitana TaxID=1128676 RepID=UPI0011BF9FE2|nr:hypothetical protein [Pseudonocardia hierapolitana]